MDGSPTDCVKQLAAYYMKPPDQMTLEEIHNYRRIAMTYGYAYVARVAMGANKMQTIRAFLEAEAYPGPSLIITYSQCIAGGIDMVKGVQQQKLAVDSGIWTMFRFNLELREQGKNPFVLDSREPKEDVKDYMYNDVRFRARRMMRPQDAEEYLEVARRSADQAYRTLCPTCCQEPFCSDSGVKWHYQQGLPKRQDSVTIQISGLMNTGGWGACDHAAMEWVGR